MGASVRRSRTQDGCEPVVIERRRWAGDDYGLRIAVTATPDSMSGRVTGGFEPGSTFEIDRGEVGPAVDLTAGECELVMEALEDA